MSGRIDPKSAWQAVAALLVEQHGVVSRMQLRELGLSPDRIDHAVATGRLRVVHRGVYVAGGPLTTMSRWWAGVLACGEGAALAGTGAAALWEMRPSSSPLVDIVVPSRRRRVREGLRVHCHPTLGDDEVTVRSGLRVTTVARTLLDVAGRMPRHETRKAVAQAEILHLFDLHAVVALAERHPRHRGRRVLESILEGWTTPDRVRSILEEAFLEVCAREGFPRPLMNSVVLGMEVDALFPDPGVAVELDGRGPHTGWARREDDYEKRARLSAAGWHVVPFTYRQVVADRGEAVARTLRPMLGGPTGDRPPPNRGTGSS